MDMSSAVVILADGFEEIEAVTQIDVLRRAGVEVTVAGLAGTSARGAHGIEIGTEILLDDLDFEPDMVVLPGGMPGSKNLGDDRRVISLLERQHGAGRRIAAICAAPAFAPVKAGVLDGKRATCYPSFETRFNAGTVAVVDRVVVDGTVTTSRGPGTALEFALELAAQLAGKAKADELRTGMLVE
jgi:4-methyl-5(b-hydroxyethyl)-thiazole monophosphate biosynthesis